MVAIRVNDKRIEVPEGTVLLKACLDNGFNIPNLCYLDGIEPPAACRLCFVEIDGFEQPVAACSVRVEPDMFVRTDSPSIRRLQKAALKLLLSVHDVDCKNCHANHKCALQDLSRYLKVGLKTKGLDNLIKEPSIDDRHACLDYHTNRCVLCGRCVEICRKSGVRPELTFAGRGFETVVSFFVADTAGQKDCMTCRACVDICPVGALSLKDRCLDTAE